MKFDISQPAYLRFRSIAAERTTPVVAWVGSGLSTPAGLPTWPKLGAALLDAAQHKVSSLEPDDPVWKESQENLIKRAETTENFWQAFEMLRRILGQSSYRDSIRQTFAPAITAQIPPAYFDLWNLHLSGVINLNLDRLATRAYTKVKPGTAPFEFNGSQTAAWIHVLKTTHPFILNMHGITEDASSWVLTSTELRSLFDTAGYDEFIVSCLTSRTILFVGITADDISVGGHLERLANKKIDFGTHYWLTDRTDIETDKWAERVGVSMIRYNAPNNDHSAVAEFFSDVLSFVPTDSVPVPVTLPLAPPTTIPSPKDLRREDAETIRKVLNARASEILQGGSEEEYLEYEQFCKTYNEAVYRAWYVDIEDGDNELLGYKLLARAGGGAFGNVYRALSPSHETVAVKILHEEVRKAPEMLQSFRRGVRSMQILSNAKLDGIVRYREASEIPAFVVMDWVNGPNLREVIQARQLNGWDEILRVATELAKIIRSAHMLPDRVLHRDLRPANIMLEDYWADPYTWHLVVLDFDLSYHVGSKEKTIDLRGESATGYLAPEQLQKLPGISTRNAAVDSFGFGMTLYYLVSHKDPLPAEHLHGNWLATVAGACEARECDQWLSLPGRVARVIRQCTRNQQSERWDLSQVGGELSRLLDVLDTSSNRASAELIAEELIARSFGVDRYTWYEDTLKAELELASGLTFSISGDDPNEMIVLRLTWQDKGDAGKRNRAKWLQESIQSAANSLKEKGWSINNATCYGQSAHLKATIEVCTVARNFSLATSTLKTVAQRWRNQ